MRTWSPALPVGESAHALLAARMPEVVPALGDAAFGPRLLQAVAATLPVASFSIYRTGARPAIFISGSLGVPDTTRDCWRAYLSGPVQYDRTFRDGETAPLRMCHITAGEVPPEHRAKVYDAHGVRERVSVVEREPSADGALFAVNFYRHEGQRPLADGQLADFGEAGALLMALARKHVVLASPPQESAGQAQRLLAHCPELTSRELEVCLRLLRGMTQEGIAADLGLALPTVKTYRNRAFARLGIHFRSELFALMLEAGEGAVAAR